MRRAKGVDISLFLAKVRCSKGNKECILPLDQVSYLNNEGSMKEIQIDTDMLIFALEDHGFERDYFLDTKSGEIVTLTDFDNLFEEEELRESIEAEENRYLYIEPLDSRESFYVMERFLYTLPEGRTKNDLAAALSGHKPFRRFKDILYNYPEIREKWFLFHNQELKKIVREWLHYNDVEAELLPLPEEKERMEE